MDYTMLLNEMNFNNFSLSLNEAYYGKNKDLLYIEKRIIPKIRECSLHNKSIKKYCANEIHEMERIFSKLFNIEQVEIIIGFLSPQMNACTMTISMNDSQNGFFTKATQDEYKMISNANGIKYINGKNKKMTMYILPNVFELKDTEIAMGIILHEIGHNFFAFNNYYKNFQTIAVITTAAEIFTDILLAPKRAFEIFKNNILKLFVTIGEYNPAFRKFLVKIQVLLSGMEDFVTDTIEVNEFLRIVVTIINVLLEFAGLLVVFVPFKWLLGIGGLLGIVGKEKFLLLIITIIMGVIVKILLKLIPFSINSINYENEKFADNFATSFGYGSGIVGGFSDMNNILPNVAFESGSALNQLSKLNYILAMHIGGLFDVHPQNVARCEAVIKKYEYELNNNKNLSKKQKEEIKKDLLKCKKIIKEHEQNDLSYKTGKLLGFIDKIKNSISNTVNGISDSDIYNFEKTYKTQGLMEGVNDMYLSEELQYELLTEGISEDEFLEAYYELQEDLDIILETSSRNKLIHQNIIDSERSKAIDSGNYDKADELETYRPNGKHPKRDYGVDTSLRRKRLNSQGKIGNNEVINSVKLNRKKVSPESAVWHNMSQAMKRSKSLMNITTNSGSKSTYYTKKGKYQQTPKGIKKVK